MKLTQLSLYALVAIAAIGGSPSAALSQSTVDNPTQPTLSEITPLQNRQTEGIKTQMQPQAVGLQPSGQTFFSHPPRLTRVNASQKSSYVPSTYEFTLVVPANAGAALKAVTIVQDKNLETISFDVNRSKAFAGEQFTAGREVPLASIGGAQPAPGEVTIVFDQPVQPGSTVTVALKARANPSWGGAYEFGVTAFPTGEQSSGQFLGYQRINFSTGGD